VHYLRQGYVKSYEIKSDGTCQIISVFGPGEIFPIYWSFGEGEVNLYYEAISEVKVSIKPRDVFIRETKLSPPNLQAVVHYLLRNYRFSQQRIQNLEYFSVPERVAFRLLFLAEYFGHKSGNKTVIDVPCRYQDIADAINSSRDTVSRAVSEFISKKIVSRKHATITINSISRLKELVDKSGK
jgi:CRP/FNR family transcriptional regulator